jgi:hypothetical protein
VPPACQFVPAHRSRAGKHRYAGILVITARRSVRLQAHRPNFQSPADTQRKGMSENDDLRPQNTAARVIIDMQTDFCGVGG